MADVRNIEAIVIGGSAGALEALAALLPALPRDFPIPIALVVHLPPTKPSLVAHVLASKCSLRVKEPDDKEPLAPATLYVAPPNYHLLMEKSRCFSLSVDDPVLFSRPSIDVLFESAADAWGPALAGLILTGANEDGARGLRAIQDAGGLTIVQSPATALVATMPEAALRLGKPDHVLPLQEIGAFLASLADAAPGNEVFE
jgi:two-component system chemotaxis response regulator CheB